MIQIDPRVAALLEYHSARAGGGVEAEQLEVRLRAVEDLRYQRAAGGPDEAREILLISMANAAAAATAVEVHQHGLAAGDGYHRQPNARVGSPREGVCMVLR